MPRLMLFPIHPGDEGGYEKAVQSDLKRLEPTPDDTVVIYTRNPDPRHPGAVRLEPPGKTGLRRFTNTFLGAPSVEVGAAQLRPFTDGKTFDEVFCGEVIFYRAARALFPDRPITVRFHNYFCQAQLRQKYLRLPIGLKFWINLQVFSRLERKIARDKLVHPIFINEQEQRFHQVVYPDRGGEVWPIEPPAIVPPKAPTRARLIWFGSVTAHKAYSVQRFLSDVWPELRQQIPGVEFHLFGNGTPGFDDPTQNVFGHGFHDGDGLPMDGDGLFVNPDLLGGGVKIKIGDLLAHGAPFISTPFGMEGSPHPDSEHILVADLDRWASLILDYFQQLGLRQ